VQLCQRLYKHHLRSGAKTVCHQQETSVRFDGPLTKLDLDELCKVVGVPAAFGDITLASIDARGLPVSAGCQVVRPPEDLRSDRTHAD
jgi:hypothetical protein